MSVTEVNSQQTPSVKTGMFINRNYGFLFTGQFISLIGDQIFDLTLILWITLILAKGQAWAPLAVSGLLVVTSIPIFIIGPIAGIYVDRWNRRTTMLWMDIIRAILIASLLAISGIIPLPKSIAGFTTHNAAIWYIYLIVFLESSCSQFFSPARFALIGETVAAPQRAQATGLAQLSQAIAAIAGPPIAAPLLIGFGVQWALGVNAISFLLSFLAVSFVRYIPTKKIQPANEGKSKEFMQGVRLIFGNTFLRAIAAASFFMMVGLGAFIALIVFFITNNLHASPTKLGVLMGVFGGGAVVGAIIFSIFMNRLGIERVYVWSIMFSGILLLGFSRLSNIYFAFIFVFIIGVLQSALNIATSPLVLRETPNAMLGRVSAILTPFGTLGTMAATGLAGFLASTALLHFHAQFVGMTFGPIDTIIGGAGLIVILAGAVAGFSIRSRTAAKTPTAEQSA